MFRGGAGCAFALAREQVRKCKACDDIDGLTWRGRGRMFWPRTRAMPIYAYECTKCGEQAEYIQKISDAPMKKCESCGGKLSKLMTAASFHLKGGGWYKDGYASTTKSSGSSADSNSGSASAGSDD